MKLMDLLCSSNASTAINSRMHHRSTTTPKYHNHHEKRKNQLLPHVPCSSQIPPINPKPYFEKHRKSTSSSSKINISSDMMRRHSSVELSDLYDNNTHHNNHRYSTDDGDGSRRYLLGVAPFIDWVSSSESDNNKIPISMVPNSSHHQHHDDDDAKAKHMLVNRKNYGSAALRSSSVRERNQVVVLRVSLHCKACEGKVRKHISKMEGVTSFSIEMEKKKVTIMGDVTPLGVLASVSKVKSAQLWPYDNNPTSISTSSSSSSSSSSSMPQSPWST